MSLTCPLIYFIVMLSVCKSEVYAYLCGSEFYKSLSDDNSEIAIPTQCYWPDSEVQTDVDCENLLHTIRYWGVDTIPKGLIVFLMNCKTENCDRMASLFASELSFLHSITSMKVGEGDEKSKAAAQSGRAELVEHLIEEKLLQPGEVCEVVAMRQSCDLLRYFHEKGYVLSSSNCLMNAATHGSLECIKYLAAQGCLWDEFTCVYAAEGGHLDCLRYLHEQGCPWDANTCSYAAMNGHIHCLVYAHEAGCTWDSETSSYAASGGHQCCLQFLHERGCPWEEDKVTEAAASEGHVACLQYLHEQGCPIDESTCCAAAYRGQIACLQYLHGIGCSWGVGVTEAAARGGQLMCLQYLHEQGCAWDSETCTAAASNGHLKCLVYAHDLGCEWSYLTAKRANSLECEEYLLQHNCPRELEPSSPYKSHSCMYTCI